MVRYVSHNESVGWWDNCLCSEGTSRQLGCPHLVAAIDSVTACASLGAVRCSSRMRGNLVNVLAALGVRRAEVGSEASDPRKLEGESGKRNPLQSDQVLVKVVPLMSKGKESPGSISM